MKYDPLTRTDKRAIYALVVQERSFLDLRKVRRNLRAAATRDTAYINSIVPKPGKFISEHFRSSRAFKSAYGRHRREIEFNDTRLWRDW